MPDNQRVVGIKSVGIGLAISIAQQTKKKSRDHEKLNNHNRNNYLLRS